MDGYKVDRTILSSEDMQAILSGLKSLDSVSGTNRYRQLMEKISADDNASINADNHIIVDLSNWDKSVVADKIELIKKAIEQQYIISFRYFSPNGESKRRMEPYHLIFQWSNWYVWGYCYLRNDYRMFKLTRLTDLECTGESCELREVPEYTCDKLRHTKGEIEVTARFEKSLKWRIIDEFGAEIPRFDENGDILLTFTWSDIPSFYSYILSFGDKAEIISPKESRREFRELIKRISEKY